MNDPNKQLQTLIESEVPYREYQREVQSFLKNNGKEAARLLMEIHGIKEQRKRVRTKQTI